MIRFFILILFSITVASATVTITQEHQLANNFTLPYLYDASRALDIQDISQKEFDKNVSNFFAFGHRDGNTWFQLKLKNETENNSLVLYLDEPLYVVFNLFYKVDGKYIKKECGLFVPLKDRDKAHIYPVFTLDIKAGETKTFYIQAHSKLSQLGAIKIATKKVFESHRENLSMYLYSFYFGGLFIMFLLSFFLFIKVKERIYAFYTGYIIATAVFVFVLSGICIYFGFAPWFYELQSAVPIMMVFLILFSIELLHVKEYMPIFYKILLGFIIIFLLLAALIIYDLKPWLEIMNNVATLALLTLIFVSVKIRAKGNANAKLYLPIMVTYVLSLALMSSVFAGDIENSTFSRSAFMFASYFELAFFSLILANKIYRTKSLEMERQEFENLSNKDPLSSLHNRRYFTKISKSMFNFAQQNTQNLSILMIDIDKFKKINDTYGHEVGDKVIIKVSQTLLSLVRQNDVVARYGGEEFVIIFAKMPKKRIMSFANDICTSIEALEIAINDAEHIKTTVSIGVSEINLHSDTHVEEITKRADQALYEAKAQGRNRVIYFEQK